MVVTITPHARPLSLSTPPGNQRVLMLIDALIIAGKAKSGLQTQTVTDILSARDAAPHSPNRDQQKHHREGRVTSFAAALRSRACHLLSKWAPCSNSKDRTYDSRPASSPWYRDSRGQFSKMSHELQIPQASRTSISSHACSFRKCRRICRYAFFTSPRSLAIRLLCCLRCAYRKQQSKCSRRGQMHHRTTNTSVTGVWNKICSRMSKTKTPPHKNHSNFFGGGQLP